MNYKKSIGKILYISWCGLGYYRGINSYNYNYKKYNIGENKLYIDKILHGFLGLSIYSFHVYLPILIYKEIYRLEVNMKNLEDEQKSNYYFILLF